MSYAIYLATLTAMFISLALALRILVGMCGIVSVSHAAFFGVGAYGAVIAQQQFGLPPFLALPVLAAAGAALGYVAAHSALRISDDYLVIYTLALQLIFTNLVRNGGAVTGGPAGISGVPPIVGAGGIAADLVLLATIAALVVLFVLCSLALRRAPFGRALQAMRDDELFTRSVGKNTPMLKTSAFALSTAMAVMAGSLYPYFTGFIDPTQFTISQSIAVLSMVIIGGAHRISGTIIGAAVLTLLPEALRGLGLPGPIGNIRQIILGLLLTLIVIARPDGLAGTGAASRRGEPRA